MPKLNNTHLSTRIARELKRLKDGDPLIVRNVRAVLSDEQIISVDTAWTEQKLLHRGKRPKDEAERIELGMKDKRELYIDALSNALIEANSNSLEFLKGAQAQAARRQIKIYTDAVMEAGKEGKDIQTARNCANNELTRAGLNRLDRAPVGLNKRDQEVHSIEEQLKARFRAEMTEEELEQQKLLEQFLKLKDS